MGRFFIPRQWRLPRYVYFLMIFEFPLTVANLALFGIASPNLYRTILWTEGGKMGFNSDPSTVVYAYANYRPVTIPLVWSGFNTQYHLVIGVVCMFFWLVKMAMWLLHVFYPIFSVLLHIPLLAIWAYGIHIQTSPDTIDPTRSNSGAPWYITKNCNIVDDKQIRSYCMQAKSSFAVSCIMISIYAMFLILSFYSLWPTKQALEAHQTRQAEKRAEKEKWAYTPDGSEETTAEQQWQRAWELQQLPRTPGAANAMHFKSPMTPRTRAFGDLEGGAYQQQEIQPHPSWVAHAHGQTAPGAAAGSWYGGRPDAGFAPVQQADRPNGKPYTRRQNANISAKHQGLCGLHIPGMRSGKRGKQTHPHASLQQDNSLARGDLDKDFVFRWTRAVHLGIVERNDPAFPLAHSIPLSLPDATAPLKPSSVASSNTSAAECRRDHGHTTPSNMDRGKQRADSDSALEFEPDNRADEEEGEEGDKDEEEAHQQFGTDTGVESEADIDVDVYVDVDVDPESRRSTKRKKNRKSGPHASKTKVVIRVHHMISGNPKTTTTVLLRSTISMIFLRLQGLSSQGIRNACSGMVPGKPTFLVKFRFGATAVGRPMRFNGTLCSCIDLRWRQQKPSLIQNRRLAQKSRTHATGVPVETRPMSAQRHAQRTRPGTNA
ncbi:hypothetical protein OPT61_g7627 [Boeremia exigua]|uniref:Uncharacterized protein n=1 Tax=Boeremia exigua TaxID=749465 RepID=A0ACC2I1H1_9PLEO|nr:hypothetical protein OPT61_g7627 [Boeremia exigua]